MASIILKPGRDKSLRRHHPWIFSGAVARLDGDAQPGETVDILTSKDEWLARGAYSPQSQIIVRVWSFEESEQITAEFFHRRVRRAMEGRSVLMNTPSMTAYRLVYAESDGLPGVIIDQYGTFLVCQFLTTGAEYWKQTIVEELAEFVPHTGLYERSDAAARKKEGLPASTGVLLGQKPPDEVEIQEGTLRFLVNIHQGHKTGFYLDQRDNRAHLAQYVSEAEVLNCFAYTGGFGVAAAKFGAQRVTHIEASGETLELARRNVELNASESTTTEFVRDDVFTVLRTYRDSRRSFECIILDPPKFAESKRQLQGACRGYKDINLLAMKLLRPGGYLVTFSCSGLMTSELFQKIVADAALDARRHAHIVQRLSQASDHPIALNFPEGHYLKGLVCQVW